MIDNPNELTPEDEKLIEQAEQQVAPTASEVTTEDLSSSDLLANDVPIENIEQDPSGVLAFNDDLAEPAHEDTIEERILQEEPDPGADTLPEEPVTNEPGVPKDDEPGSVDVLPDL